MICLLNGFFNLFYLPELFLSKGFDCFCGLRHWVLASLLYAQDTQCIHKSRM
jgi:hypothetical protein